MKINSLVVSNVAGRLTLTVMFSVFFTFAAYAAESIDCDKSNCNDLADQYFEADNIEIAAKAYTKGCELNDSTSCYNIATIYEDGYIGEPDFLKAVPFYQKGCELLDSDACTELADEYDDAEDDVNALVYYDAACKLDDGYGCHRQAWILDSSITVRDLERATALYAKSCKLEYGWSCNNLGYDYMGYDDEPNPYVTKNYEKGLELMTLACETHGIGTACTTLSHAYDKGHGVKKNASESLRYSIKACEGVDDNHGGGCFNAAIDYEEGNSVKIDLKRAHYFYEQGCKLDDSDACWNVGVNRENGYGVSKSLRKARYFYQRACELGNEDSCQEIAD